MPYQINGTGIPLEPEEGRWLERDMLGYDGNGRPLYAPTHQFEMRWGLMSAGEVWQLQSWFQSVGATGSVVVGLPRYAWPAYEFRNYSGCYISEPTVNTYFTEHYTDVKLLVTNIRVEEV